MRKVKYSPEMKEQTVKYVLEGNKSATKVAKELGIDTNTVCRWVREYREAHQMPTYEVERKIKKQSADELIARNKELEKELRRKEKELADEKEKVEILKKSLHIFMQAEEWCKKLMQYQASPYSKTTKGAWNCRFDDVVAEAKRLGRLKNKDFDLPAETKKMLEDATPKGVPKYVLPELAKYYIANKQEDSDKVVLPVSNFSAYFGKTSFERKWLKILPEDIIVREEYAGVCRIRMKMK